MNIPKNQHGFTIVELLIVVVVIAILAAITIVSYNGITERAKESSKVSELSQWKKKSELYKIEKNIECPNNYVFIYGNTTLGTSDFCVMKYEARIQANDNGQTTYASSMVADARPTGTPWVNITQTNAITEGNATCAGCHLLTDAEWMTIAADVLSVKYNWSGGTVGSGYIYSGHNDNSPANAIAATSDDTDSYNGTGNSATTGPNQKRTLYLTSGDVIWDFAGNVWEWTSNTITGAQPGASGYAWRDYPSISSWGNLPANSRPSALATIPELSAIGSWDANKGIGRIYSNSAETGARAFDRGGDWYSGSRAGVLALVLSYVLSDADMYVGFRVAR